MRPTFERHFACPPKQITQRLRATLTRESVPYRGDFYANHIVVSVPTDDEHFWSPQLSLDLQATESGTVVRGIYAPRPSVWTMFMAMYAFAGFGGVIGMVFGSSQWSLGMEATALWAVPGALVMATLTYGLALVGQWLSRDQIRDLRTFTERSLDACMV
jgi:hypothetical protein